MEAPAAEGAASEGGEESGRCCCCCAELLLRWCADGHTDESKYQSVDGNGSAIAENGGAKRLATAEKLSPLTVDDDSGAAADKPDLFREFEAKARLFAQLAADASVEVGFAEQEESSGGSMILPGVHTAVVLFTERGTLGLKLVENAGRASSLG